MINTYNAMQHNKLSQCEDKFAYPIMRWLSGSARNMQVCNHANTKFFKLKPRYIFSLLSLCPDKGFIGYPKAAKKPADEMFELLMPYLKKLYNWSELEIQKNKSVLSTLVNDIEFVKDLNSKMGFTKQECSKLGIPFKVKKYDYQERPATKNLFDF
jgi:hypothetical protein